MNKLIRTLGVIIVCIAITYVVTPKPRLLENFTFSSAVYDRNGKLLRLTLSQDEKYRLFVPIEKIPEDFKKALILYEDRNFYYHKGIDPTAVIRVVMSMINNGRKQGASTISMQLARLVYNIDSTSISGKIYQMIKATQIEMFYNKNEILEAYFNLSPYGNNIEGIGAASLIYFKNDVSKVSLPEILGLTVIPQNPSKRNPSRYFENMIEAQKRLAEIWQETYPNDSNNKYLNLPIKVESKQEIPFLAPHFTNQVLQQRTGTLQSTLDLGLQKKIEEITSNYIKRNESKGIKNAAVFLIDYQTMEVLAQVGSADFHNTQILGQVDGTRAKRSPGSTMKPFIYTIALEQGIIHPMTMLKDLPKNYAFYTPENFDRTYKGIINATNALVYSMNIPAVELLQKTKAHNFYNFMKESGVTKLKSEEFYGLALALGGFETSPQEVVKMYATLANLGKSQEIKFLKEEKTKEEKQLLSPEASFLTLKMLSFNTPTDKITRHPIYWKTGTSYSYKDAWSVGIAGKYVLAVWIGNFDATPNHSFIGQKAAAPLFFEIIRSLEKSDNFNQYEISSDGLNLSKVNICRSTGDIANKYCKNTVSSWFIPGVSPIKISQIHREIPINVKTGLRACRHTPPHTKLKIFEFWPSDILKAFEQSGISKKLPPMFEEDCNRINPNRGHAPIITYPVSDITYIIRSHRLKDEKITLKASADPDATAIYWFLNNSLIGETKPDETMQFPAKVGMFTIKAIDNLGRQSRRKITIQLAD